jgi:predicted nucleic acid-binding protein
VLEEGTEKVNDTFLEALSGGTASLHFSIWNIGEVLGALHAYYRRKWLESEDYATARESFIAETTRLIKLGVAKVMPVRSKLLTQSWLFVEKYHIDVADALQIISAKNLGVDRLLSGDRRLVDVSREEGVDSEYLG